MCCWCVFSVLLGGTRVSAGLGIVSSGLFGLLLLLLVQLLLKVKVLLLLLKVLLMFWCHPLAVHHIHPSVLVQCRLLLLVVLMLQEGLVLGGGRGGKIEARWGHEGHARTRWRDAGPRVGSHTGTGAAGKAGRHLAHHGRTAAGGHARGRHRERARVGPGPGALAHGSHVERDALAHDRRVVERTAAARERRRRLGAVGLSAGLSRGGTGGLGALRATAGARGIAGRRCVDSLLLELLLKVVLLLLLLMVELLLVVVEMLRVGLLADGWGGV